MYSQGLKHRNRYFYTINQNNSYIVIVQDTTHYDFLDISYIFKNLLNIVTEMYGKIDANEMITIINDYVLAFFNKYLKCTESPLFETNPYNMVAFEKHF